MMKLLYKSILFAAGYLVLNASSSQDPLKADSLGRRETTNEVSKLRIPSLPPLPDLKDWADNPASEEKRILGAMLFSDPRLSSNGTVSCGACHSVVGELQSNTPQDTPARTLPNLSPPLPRNAPSLTNIVYAEKLHWDGSESDLYQSMALPFAEANMNLSQLPQGDVWTIGIPEAQKRLQEILIHEIPGYSVAFSKAFGVDFAKMDAEQVWLLTGKALAIYIRDAVSRNSAFDKWNAGDDSALSVKQLDGLKVFMGKGSCVSCHNGPMLSDYQYYNMSLVNEPTYPGLLDEGRMRVTGDPADRGKFLTPTLRRVVKSSPFFHDGSEVSIRAVIARHASESARVDKNHASVLDKLEPLTKDEMEALVSFLVSLQGEPLPVKRLLDYPKDLPQ